ncbi:hypothetical protein [Pseudonocardia sp. GCM10023141]|uniref:hypothetical protein n=1 Tax=Pseudonocardia sp. GCM10023141 TaxID=3252653 RepID=UPI003615A8CC
MDITSRISCRAVGLVGADPGLNRLIVAPPTTPAIAAAIAAEWQFVRLTGARQIADSAGQGDTPKQLDVLIDGATADIYDDDNYRRSADCGAGFGFMSKMCIRPRQVGVANPGSS